MRLLLKVTSNLLFWVAVSPLWFVLGITLTIMDYIIFTTIRRANMANHPPARIVRYGDIPEAGVLSVFDAKKNILLIDRYERARLPESMQNLLDTTRIERTMVIYDQRGMRFGEFRPQTITIN